jgi:hypothetical protein
MIKWLFLKTKINKLHLEEGDILVLRPPTKGWNMNQANQYHKFVEQILRDFKYNNITVTFMDDIDLGIISTGKSNFTHKGDINGKLL